MIYQNNINDPGRIETLFNEFWDDRIKSLTESDHYITKYGIFYSNYWVIKFKRAADIRDVNNVDKKTNSGEKMVYQKSKKSERKTNH